MTSFLRGHYQITSTTYQNMKAKIKEWIKEKLKELADLVDKWLDQGQYQPTNQEPTEYS